MPQIPLIMPQLGESIAEATVINFLVQIGDHVQTDQDVMEVETNKATMNVTSPCPGRVHELLAKVNESYPVGAVLGHLEVSEEDANRLGLERPSPVEIADKPEPATEGTSKDLSIGKETGSAANRARFACSGLCRGRELHVTPHESAHERIGAARGGPRWNCRERRRRPGDHPGFRKIRRQPGKKQADAGFLDARGCGGCHAPKLDSALGDGRFARQHGSIAGPSEEL